MILPTKIRIILIFSLITVFFMVIISSSMVTAQADPFSEVEEKLAHITDEEKEILQNLVDLTLEIENMEKEEEILKSEIEVIMGEIEHLKELIKEEEIAYEKNLCVMKEVLRSYQRSGSGSYLEIVLESDSLTMLIRRLNTLREITRRTGQLLDTLEESRNLLFIEKGKSDEKLVLLKEKQEHLKESKIKKLKAKEDKEKYLVSINEERAYYQEYLSDMHRVWDELKPLFIESTTELTRMIKEGNLPLSTVETTFTINGIKGVIHEKTFNDLIAKHARLQKMEFSFYPEEIQIAMPEKNFVLYGTFAISEGYILKFEVKGGSFFGIPIEKDVLEVLFQEGNMELNLKPLVGDNTIQSIQIKEGYLELHVKPVLFQ